MSARPGSSVDWLLEQTEACKRLRAQREREENEGARIADDCFCRGCGARGYAGKCPTCQAEESGAGR